MSIAGVALVTALVFIGLDARESNNAEAGGGCPVTKLAEEGAPSAHMRGLSRSWLRSGRLWMGFTRGSENFESRPVVGQKIAWYREVRGPLRVLGQRIDAPAPPLTARIPYGYGRTGFQPSRLYFPTPGCWRVSGRVGTSRTFPFVVRVVPGPPNS